MRNITRKIAGITTSLVLALSMAACGGNAATVADPTNADELVERYLAKGDKDNYHAEGDLGMKISFLGMEMPMSGTIKMDNAASTNYCETDLTGEIFGESINTKSEIYTVEDPESKAIVNYSCTTTGDTEGTWMMTETEASETIHENLLAADSMRKAEFAATEDGYTLTMDSANVDALLKALNMNTAELTEALGDGFTTTPSDDTSVVYTFNKDCYPTNITFKIGYEFTYNGSEDDVIDLSGMSMGIGVDLNLNYSGYGTIDEASITVPEDVKANAVEGEINDGPSALEEVIDNAAPEAVATTETTQDAA